MAMPTTVAEAIHTKTTAPLQELQAASKILWAEAQEWDEAFPEGDCPHICNYILVMIRYGEYFDMLIEVTQGYMQEYSDNMADEPYYPEEHDIYAQNDRCLAMLGDTCVVDSARIDIDDIPF